MKRLLVTPLTILSLSSCQSDDTGKSFARVFDPGSRAAEVGPAALQIPNDSPSKLVREIKVEQLIKSTLKNYLTGEDFLVQLKRAQVEVSSSIPATESEVAVEACLQPKSKEANAMLLTASPTEDLFEKAARLKALENPTSGYRYSQPVRITNIGELVLLLDSPQPTIAIKNLCGHFLLEIPKQPAI